MTTRYEGRPLLRLLELYVLNVLGVLTSDQLRRASDFAPHLSRTFGRLGTWDEIIHAEMEFPNNFPELIRKTWVRNQEIARQNHTILTPQEFAELFIDNNIEIDRAG